MSELFIHVGLHKTGSTFLQNMVFPNIRGVDYYYKPTDEQGRCDPFNVEVSGKVLVSDEELSKSMPERDHRNRLVFLNQLKKRFPDAKIILGLREYSSWLRSCYAQYIKTGGYKIFEEYRTCFPHLKPGEYEQIIKEKWEHVFVYHQEDLKKDTDEVLKEICGFIGVDVPEYSFHSVNIGLKGWRLSFFRYINILFRGEWLRRKVESPYWILTYPYRHLFGRPFQGSKLRKSKLRRERSRYE